jgi:hypothetical protein
VLPRSLAAALLIILLGHHAKAAAQETSLALGATAAVGMLGEAGATGTLVGGGGRIRVAYGVTNAFSLTAQVQVLAAPAVKFEDALLADEQGADQEGDLYGDLWAGELSVGVRWTPRIARSLHRTRPIIGLRAGVIGRILGDQVLVDDAGQGVAGVTFDERMRFSPQVGAELGFEHRLGELLILGLVIDGSTDSSGNKSLGASLEAGFAWY